MLNEAETTLQLFQAVSIFCFSFISEFSTAFRRTVIVSYVQCDTIRCAVGTWSSRSSCTIDSDEL